VQSASEFEAKLAGHEKEGTGPGDARSSNDPISFISFHDPVSFSLVIRNRSFSLEGSSSMNYNDGSVFYGGRP
jgi:hypothetical protein